ncbi:cytochrome c [Phenylobacterium sp.]|uniref:c-type cytochrome n=1 Tax=Phenylobacterium sp. TaxID=1871053 RepID=UPI0035B1D205
MRAAVLALALLSLPALAAAAEPDASRERGRTLVQRHCAGCHAVGPQGRSPNPAAPPFRELHKRYPVENLAEALAEGIIVGHPAMPEMRFPPADVNAVIRYLKSVQAKQAASLELPPDDLR